jgi:transcriptional regulator of aromatic amino acid metabolism
MNVMLHNSAMLMNVTKIVGQKSYNAHEFDANSAMLMNVIKIVRGLHTNKFERLGSFRRMLQRSLIAQDQSGDRRIWKTK